MVCCHLFHCNRAAMSLQQSRTANGLYLQVLLIGCQELLRETFSFFIVCKMLTMQWIGCIHTTWKCFNLGAWSPVHKRADSDASGAMAPSVRGALGPVGIWQECWHYGKTGMKTTKPAVSCGTMQVCNSAQDDILGKGSGNKFVCCVCYSVYYI